LKCRQASHFIPPDVRRLDDRPPLLDLGLLLGGERLWRLLLARPDSLAQVGEPLAYCRIGQGLHDGYMSQNDACSPGIPASSNVGVSGVAGQRPLAITP